jgi:hypothetical protein
MIEFFVIQEPEVLPSFTKQHPYGNVCEGHEKTLLSERFEAK